MSKKLDFAAVAEALKHVDKALSMLVLVIRKQPDGSEHYAYASIVPSRYTAFMAAQEAGDYDLAEFGTVLFEGPGRIPPADVQKKMAKEYGITPTFEADLKQTKADPKQD